MRINRKFKQLTNFTYPHGTESALLKYLPIGYKEDGLGNYYLELGDKPSTMFTCHLDTACSYSKRVIHIEEGNFIKTDGTTILGADDKAGMTVMLYMIENNIPGLYYFFVGEEVGCIGSGKLADKWFEYDFSDYIKKVVSFDRRGTDSVITEQMFGVCCSDEFALELSSQLNLANPKFSFSPDPTGIYTDSAKFMSLVSECTNISVGYYNEHSTNEKQDMLFLRNLCAAVCKVDWENLPVTRDQSKDSWSYYGNDDYDNENVWSGENYSYFNNGTSVEKLHISDSYIKEEKSLIHNWLINSNIYPGFKSISWNGNDLYIETDRMEFVGDRVDIIEFLPDLGSVPMSVLKNIK